LPIPVTKYYCALVNNIKDIPVGENLEVVPTAQKPALYPIGPEQSPEQDSTVPIICYHLLMIVSEENHLTWVRTVNCDSKKYRRGEFRNC